MTLSNISGIYLGSLGITRAYLGANLVFDAAPVPSTPTINGTPTQFSSASTTVTLLTAPHTAVSGNKLLVIAAGNTRDATIATATITYNSASASASGQISNTTGDGQQILAWALFDAPTVGSNTVSVAWSGTGVKESSAFAVNLANAGAILTQANDAAAWGNNGDHDITISAADSLLIGAVSGRGNDVFTGATSSNMTVEGFIASGATNLASCLALFSVENPSTGVFSANLGFTNTGSDWVRGLTLEIGAA